MHVLSQTLVYWLTIFACHTVLFYNLEKKKICEKLHTSLHYCLLFAIHIYFSDIFLDFLRGLNSTDNNLRDVSRGSNFTNGKFFLYFMQITFCGKIQNLRNLQNRIHAGHGVKVRPEPRDPWPPQSLKVEPGTLLKFKSGTFITKFLYCCIYNMEIIFYE